MRNTVLPSAFSLGISFFRRKHRSRPGRMILLRVLAGVSTQGIAHKMYKSAEPKEWTGSLTCDSILPVGARSFQVAINHVPAIRHLQNGERRQPPLDRRSGRSGTRQNPREEARGIFAR